MYEHTLDAMMVIFFGITFIPKIIGYFAP